MIIMIIVNFIFIASIVIHYNHFLRCILYLLVPSSSNVAFVLKNFHYFLEGFAKKKKKLGYFVFYYYFFSTHFSFISEKDFHIWSMSLIWFCIFMWNKLILW